MSPRGIRNLRHYMWSVDRRKPYTEAGIKRLPCIRCGAPAVHQWQICSDSNRYRTICSGCDIELNQMVLEWLGHPRAATLIEAYKNREPP